MFDRFGRDGNGEQGGSDEGEKAVGDCSQQYKTKCVFESVCVREVGKPRQQQQLTATPAASIQIAQQQQQ